MTVCGATVGEVNCPECFTCVPVKCLDVTGMTLDDMITAALAGARAQHPDHGLGMVCVGIPVEA